MFGYVHRLSFCLEMIRCTVLNRCSLPICNKFDINFTCRTHTTNKRSSSGSSSSSSSSSSSDDEVKKNASKTRSTEARDKLNLLLNKMITDDYSSNKYPKLELAKPKDRKQKDVRAELGTESIKKVPVEQQVIKAVKDIAKTIGGNVKQTESELLQKLLNPIKDDSSQSASSNLNELFKDMKIDRETKAPESVSRAEQVRQLLQSVTGKQQKVQSKTATQKQSRKIKEDRIKINLTREDINLFEGKRLNIFPSLEEVEKWSNPPVNKVWDTLHKKELQLAVTHPPANYFQQMILWTEQGKLWKFPIDNEQDLEAEKKVYFTEHVFLEKHLDPWCPPKGPIRHFMELVCVGLSKNPYLTVEKKKEHLEWFRNYFNEKKHILMEVGAIPPGFSFEKQVDTKKIEY